MGKGRNRQFFKNKSEAETVLQQKVVEQANYGVAALAFTERQRAEYLECVEKLAPFNVTLRDAVRFYLPHLRATNRSCTAKQLVEEIVKAKGADGASKRYLSDLRSRLNQLQRVLTASRLRRLPQWKSIIGFAAWLIRKQTNPWHLRRAIISGAS